MLSPQNILSKNPKSSTIYTPAFLVEQIWNIIDEAGIEYKTILDPSIGSGNLIKDVQDKLVIGVDIEDKGLSVNKFVQKKFEETTIDDYELFGNKVDLIICNPPFNGHPSRKLYPEVFLRHMTELFGNIPIVMITPPTLRLNQRKNSSRWKWMRDNVEISSILTLPIDIFENTLFHSEVIFFNFPRKNIKAHYFLEKSE